MKAKTLIAGLGSPHGDDRIGWLVAERLTAAVPDDVDVRAAVHPLDVIDWLDGLERLFVIDACEPSDCLGPIHRWDWPTDEIACLRSTGTHDFGLPQVLRLAGRLERLPAEVVVFGIATRSCEPGNSLSAEAGDWIREATDSIIAELARSTGQVTASVNTTARGFGADPIPRGHFSRSIQHVARDAKSSAVESNDN